jgi:hypothetical protein
MRGERTRRTHRCGSFDSEHVEGFPNPSIGTSGRVLRSVGTIRAASLPKKTPPEAGNTTRSQRVSEETRELRGVRGKKVRQNLVGNSAEMVLMV